MRPRRCSKKWLDDDCPDGVLCLFDHPDFGDRYSVVYAKVPLGEVVSGRAMSEDPYHPQGVGMTFEMDLPALADYRCANRDHYTKWSTLPPKVKHCIRQDLSWTGEKP